MRRKALPCLKPKNQPHLSKWLHDNDQYTSANCGSDFKDRFLWYLQKRESSSLTFILNSLLQKKKICFLFFLIIQIFLEIHFSPTISIQ